MRIFLSLIALLCLGAGQAAASGELKDGDILFQFIPCGPLCDAIAAPTPCAKDHPFNHCGVVIRRGDSLLVLEAIGRDVHATTLPAFLRRDTGEAVYVGRLKQQQGGEMRANLSRALALYGRPYDNGYLPGDSALYCTELIYESYLRDGKRIFRTEPMTFKSPAGQTDTGWITHYRNLGQPIPEGLPGTNPCGLSRDPAIRLLVLRKASVLK